jgi:uncharacterized membrane protein HdeD (DUF308 family)
MILLNRSKGFIAGILSIIFGALLIILSIFAFKDLKNIIFVTIGVLLIVINSLFLLVTLLDSNKYYLVFNLIFEIIGIVLGILFLNNDNTAVIIIVGCYMILFPIVRIFLSNDKKARLINELPSLIIGILLILFSFALDDILKIVTIVIGAIIVCYGIFDIIITFKLKRDINKLNEMNSESYQSDKRHDSIDAEVKDL